MKTRLLVIGLAATATLVGCATPQPQYGSYRGDRDYDQGYSQTQRCVDCGIVTRIDEVAPTRSAPTGTGAVLGGIVGAVAGRQISRTPAAAPVTRTFQRSLAPLRVRWRVTRSRTTSPAPASTCRYAWTTAA